MQPREVNKHRQHLARTSMHDKQSVMIVEEDILQLIAIDLETGGEAVERQLQADNPLLCGRI